MADPFVAEIRIFAGNFAPRGWALCDGQLLPISQNTALFSLLGTFYGGNGQSNFALPNLQGSAPMHQGQGPGLSQRFLGEQSGSENVTLLVSEMPFHNHTYGARPTGAIPPEASPVGLGAARTNSRPYTPTATASAPMDFSAVLINGSSLPHNNMMPYLTVTFIIAMQGVFPPRS
jgi:microcystin-dependent protein